jgi:hypothetical protein
MDYGLSHVQGQEYQQRTNSTGGDMPTGYRPCPFCHSVISWESERCPSCGRVLIERVGSGPSQTPLSVSRLARRTSWWSAGVHPVLARCSARSWWLGSIAAPTEQERRIFFIASTLMVVLFVVALLSR